MILLGKTITVVEAASKELVGLTGEVIEDNRDTLKIRTARGEKLLVKHTLTIRSEGFIIEGAALVGTHAQRTKK